MPPGSRPPYLDAHAKRIRARLERDEAKYEEAASICDCALGTMKSRVSRARAALEEIMNNGQFSQKRADAPPSSEAVDAIMDSVETIAARREAANR